MTSPSKRGRPPLYAGVTDEGCGLDVRMLQRGALLLPGQCFSMRWPDESVAHYFQVADALDSLMAHGAAAGRPLRLPLDWTPCTFGGARAWFLCPAPGCGRRVALLYGGPAFRCRHCLNLTFRSRRLDTHDRALYRAQLLRVRLGGSPNIFAPLPPRPKGIHKWTHTRKGIAIFSAELRAARAVISRFETTRVPS